MDQNQTVDNDLQKAIDDITNTTNIDPVFSDPVAAPSSVPEGDTGELGEPVGPFPGATPEMPAPAPEPIAPLNPAAAATPDFGPAPMAPSPNMSPTDFSAPEYTMSAEPSLPTPPIPEAPMPGPTVQEIVPANTSGQITPITEPQMPTESPIVEPISPEPSTQATEETYEDTDTAEIKNAALHDLAPLINKLQLDGTQKFDLCRKIGLDDKTVLSSAYQATHDIADETERAEALLQIVKSIDSEM